jgi:Flp pilus assembly protein TadB
MQTFEGTHAYELRSQPLQNLSERALAELFALVRSEVQVARVEIEEKARLGAAAGQSLGIAAVFLVIALFALSAALVAGLSTVVAPWLAALFVAILAGVIAGAFAGTAREKVSKAGGLLPTRTLDQIWYDANPPTTPLEAENRAESARQDFGKTLTAVEQRSARSSPIRDAILSGIAVTLGVVMRARTARR